MYESVGPYQVFNWFSPFKKIIFFIEICFSSGHERGKKKFWVLMRNRTSDPQIPYFDALPPSHRVSTMSEVYYEVHITRVLHTARISNVDSVMFCEQNKNDELKTYHLSYSIFYWVDRSRAVRLPCTQTQSQFLFSVTWETLDVEMEDGRRSWRLMAIR